MKLTLDVENTVTERNGKMHLDPFEPSNTLVQVGMLSDQGDEMIITFDHSEVNPTTEGFAIVQSWLSKATLLVCHNVAHDLLWLWESGFKYDGAVFDTMLAEYVMQRGQKEPLSLEACAERYELETQKQDTLKEYFKKGYSTRDIPHDELSSYLSADLHATQQLCNKQWAKLNSLDCAGLLDTVVLTNQVAICLAKIYQRGFTIDKEALKEVRDEFTKERESILSDLEGQVHELMGDTPINLNSPEQLSWIIYSRKLRNKKEWAEIVHPYMRESHFEDVVVSHTDYVYKTKAEQCPDCHGTGHIHKTKKDGTPYARPNKCKTCNASGYLFIPTKDIAGLKFNPLGVKWASANGFSTSKDSLSILENAARSRNLPDAEQFLAKVRRLSAVETYLSSFVEGIETHTKADGKLHVRLLQHRTATGRFSGADPNMQNMPRGGTFPVKKVFISRWDDGQILEADFAQLEFRAAAFLSQDIIAIEEIKNGFDVHAYTASVISDAGQPTSRQEAKAHTFAPLYGATGFGRTPSEATYYKHFTEKYDGIAQWHDTLAKEALTNRKITTPSGRQFSFPDVQRRENNSVTHFTQIKNYPVQSFATADIVPLALLHIDELLEGKNSCVVNTVHDSIVIDVHPDEKEHVINVIKQTNDELHKIILLRWGVDFNVPLLLEAKIGKNWLDTVDVL